MRIKGKRVNESYYNSIGLHRWKFTKEFRTLQIERVVPWHSVKVSPSLFVRSELLENNTKRDKATSQFVGNRIKLDDSSKTNKKKRVEFSICLEKFIF